VRRDTLERESVALGQAIALGSRATWGMATSVVDVLKGLITREVAMSNLGGPIEIARTSVQAARNGWESFWSLIAFLSLNIAILNLLPIPVLDGGQILLVLLERIKGSEFSSRSREMFARVGIVAVLMLIVFVMYNDISKLIRS
jgi:regulator of sigma E protease